MGSNGLCISPISKGQDHGRTCAHLSRFFCASIDPDYLTFLHSCDAVDLVI